MGASVFIRRGQGFENQEVTLMTTVYEELLEELEALAKAMPEDDEDLESSEEEDKDEHAEPDADDEGGPSDGDADNEYEEDLEKASCDKSMAKSLTLTLEDGSVVDAVEGIDFLMSIQHQLDAGLEGSSKVFKSISSQLKEQALLIKSLKSEVASIRAEGRGRKTAVVSMAGVPEEPMAKSMSTPSDILAKCLDAQKLGRLTALEVSIAESYLNRGMNIPDRIVSALN